MTRDANAGGDPARTLARLRVDLPEAADAEGRLPDAAELGRRVGASIADVLQALDALEVEGRLVRARCGARRLPGPPGEVMERRVDSGLGSVGELLEARLRLEPELAGLAALRATSADLRRMNRLCARVVVAADLDAQEMWNAAFHRAVAETAGNRHLLAVFDALDAVRAADPDWRAAAAAACGLCGDDLPLEETDHGAVVDAIASGDPEAAAIAMRAHLLLCAELMERAEARRQQEEGGTSRPP